MTFIDTHPLKRAFLAILLERLAALIVEQGEDLLRDAGVEAPPRAVSTMMLLGEGRAMTAADVAKALGQPHQLVTQRVDLLIELGVVTRVADPADARRKALRITAKGRRQLQALRTRVAHADEIFRDLFVELGCDLAATARAAIAALERRPLLARLQAVGADVA